MAVSIESGSQEMLCVINKHNHGGWLSGNENTSDIAEYWEYLGFSPSKADAWLEVGCFNPMAARKLSDGGWSPKEALTPWEFSSMSIAYAAASSKLPERAYIKKNVIGDFYKYTKEEEGVWK